jgi:hypothetical protein
MVAKTCSCVNPSLSILVKGLWVTLAIVLHIDQLNEKT